MYKRFATVAVVFSLLLWLSPAAQRGAVADTGYSALETVIEDRPKSGKYTPAIESSPVAVRTVPPKRIDSLKAESDFWYVNLASVNKEKKAVSQESGRKTLFQQQWFRDALWIVVLCSFVGVILWYLVTSNILRFRKQPLKINSDEREPETDDIFQRHYAGDIAATEAAGDYRLAVRLWYLWLLKEMAEKGIITYRYGRTNQDYVVQLQGTSHYHSFFRLTRNFEYTWYGQFRLSESAYRMLRDDFATFQKSLQS